MKENRLQLLTQMRHAFVELSSQLRPTTEPILALESAATSRSAGETGFRPKLDIPA